MGAQPHLPPQLLQLYNSLPRRVEPFIHHESEIAQLECLTRHKPFAHWWFHTAMVQLHGRKISKSLGNLIMVQDLLAQYAPDAIRLYLAGHH
jgi:cysteinyl-tRNA synthetase